jgi:3D (Asp-Asp-Asp) domain-containing protein
MAFIPPSISSAKTENNLFVATAYCPCEKCCGKTDGITASGIKAMQGRTIAVDKNVIPLGSTVLIYIDGELYGIFIAEDTGGAIKGNEIDIYFSDHTSAINFGVKQVRVEVVDAKG